MKINKFLLVIIVLSIIGTVFLYNGLPDLIPKHWNIKGEVDAYGSRNYILFTAMLPLLVFALIYIIPKIDPKRKSYEKHKKAYNVVQILLIIFFIIIHWIRILTALDYNIDMNMIIPILVGSLFMVIGNYMSQIRHNYFFRIRTPWTLASDVV